MTKILITDYHCASNRGDAAILEGELAAIRDQFPNADITVMTDYPDAADLIHGIESLDQSISTFKWSTIRRNVAISCLLLEASMRGQGGWLPGSEWIQSALDTKPYYDADLVISTGGQFITDAYFPAKIAVLAELYLCTQLGIPVAIYGQSIGPFDDLRYDGLVRHVLNQIDLIMTRDDPSVEFLNELGVTETPIYPLADAAWTMPLDNDPKPLQKHFPTDVSLAESDGPRVSISVRHWHLFSDEGGEKAYFKAVAETASWLIDEYDANVVFASTCTGLAGYHTDDRVAASHVIDHIPTEKRNSVKLVTEELTPQLLVELYGEMDLHIGTRMHSTILAMLAETPAIGIEYQFKTSGLYQMFGLEEYVVNIDHIASSDLKSITKQALENREEVSQRISQELPKVRSKSRRNAELLADLV